MSKEEFEEYEMLAVYTTFYFRFTEAPWIDWRETYKIFLKDLQYYSDGKSSDYIKEYESKI